MRDRRGLAGKGRPTASRRPTPRCARPAGQVSLGKGQPHAVAQEGRGLRLVEAQVGRAHLGQLIAGAEPCQRQARPPASPAPGAGHWAGAPAGAAERPGWPGPGWRGSRPTRRAGVASAGCRKIRGSAPRSLRSVAASKMRRERPAASTGISSAPTEGAATCRAADKVGAEAQWVVVGFIQRQPGHRAV